MRKNFYLNHPVVDSCAVMLVNGSGGHIAPQQFEYVFAHLHQIVQLSDQLGQTLGYPRSPWRLSDSPPRPGNSANAPLTMLTRTSSKATIYHLY